MTGEILVTGAASFIGRAVVERLAASGHTIVAVTHRAALPSAVAALCSRVIRGDLSRPRVLGEALGGVAGVCHLAAYRPADYEDPAEAAACLEVNALGTLELAQAALSRGISRIVYASASNAYCGAAGPVTEEHPIQPSGHAAWYLASKATAEFYLEKLRRSAGLSPVVLRIASCYGPGMKSEAVVARFAACARSGRPIEVLGGGRSTADFVHVLDVARCFVSALSAGAAGIYNVGTGHATSLLQLAYSVREVFGSPSSVVVRPAADTSPSLFPAISVAKAQAAWGYAPMSLPEGLGTFLECA